MTSRLPVRWRFFAVIFLLSFLAYMMRQNIHVAGEQMMPELNLSEIEMGWVYASFVWGYAISQLPGGVLGQRFGPRRTLMVAGLLWIIASALTGFLPGLYFTSSLGVLGTLIVVRFLLGVAHAPMFPVQAAAVQRWFPVGQWAMPNAIASTGLTLGAAVAQPLVAFIMVYWGWRMSFYVFVPVGVGLFALWWWYARDDPSEHPAMTLTELSVIKANRTALTQNQGFDAWKQLIRNRETLLLSGAYFSQCYVFYLFFTWFFHYLVTELGFGILETGVLAALPWITGAVTATLGGLACDALCKRLGSRWGCRLPAIIGLSCAGTFLYVGLYSSSPYLGVFLLSLCFASTQFTEGAFWSAQTFVAGPYTAPACGVMNTGGNLAGIIVATLLPFLASYFGWAAALSTGTMVALFGAGLWLLIRADRPFQPLKRSSD